MQEVSEQRRTDTHHAGPSVHTILVFRLTVLVSVRSLSEMAVVRRDSVFWIFLVLLYGMATPGATWWQEQQPASSSAECIRF